MPEVVNGMSGWRKGRSRPSWAPTCQMILRLEASLTWGCRLDIGEPREAMYAEEWQGWDDFLGVILPYSQAQLPCSQATCPGQARLVSRMLGLKSQDDWYTFVESDSVRRVAPIYSSWTVSRALGLRGLRLPALPAVYYKTDWQGYEDGFHRLNGGFLQRACKTSPE